MADPSDNSPEPTKPMPIKDNAPPTPEPHQQPQYPTTSNFLPTTSNFLSIGPVVRSTTTAAVAASNYLDVTPSITPPAVYSTANPSDYLPVKPEPNPSDSPSVILPASHSDYIPTLNSDGPSLLVVPLPIPTSYFPYVLSRSLFLPVGSDPNATPGSSPMLLPVSQHEETKTDDLSNGNPFEPTIP